MRFTLYIYGGGEKVSTFSLAGLFINFPGFSFRVGFELRRAGRMLCRRSGLEFKPPN